MPSGENPSPPTPAMAEAGAVGFSTTDWSMVLEAANPATPEGAAALEQLCARAWTPLYAHLRRRGHAPEDAADLTQDFLARFLEKGYLRAARQERGRLRSFLLSALNHFVTNHWRKEHAGKRHAGSAPLRFTIEGQLDDAEARYQSLLPKVLDPVEAYDREWAIGVMERALRRLEKEFVAERKSVEFEALRPYLGKEGTLEAYGALSELLGLSAATIAVTVHRFRKRYAETVRSEIAGTVVRPLEVDGELRYLIELLSR